MPKLGKGRPEASVRASLERTITDSFNELTMQNGTALTAEQQLSLIDQYGGLDASFPGESPVPAATVRFSAGPVR